MLNRICLRFKHVIGWSTQLSKCNSTKLLYLDGFLITCVLLFGKTHGMELGQIILFSSKGVVQHEVGACGPISLYRARFLEFSWVLLLNITLPESALFQMYIHCEDTSNKSRIYNGNMVYHKWYGDIRLFSSLRFRYVMHLTQGQQISTLREKVHVPLLEHCIRQNKIWMTENNSDIFLYLIKLLSEEYLISLVKNVMGTFKKNATVSKSVSCT